MDMKIYPSQLLWYIDRRNRRDTHNTERHPLEVTVSIREVIIHCNIAQIFVVQADDDAEEYDRQESEGEEKRSMELR